MSTIRLYLNSLKSQLQCKHIIAIAFAKTDNEKTGSADGEHICYRGSIRVPRLQTSKKDKIHFHAFYFKFGSQSYHSMIQGKEFK